MKAPVLMMVSAVSSSMIWGKLAEVGKWANGQMGFFSVGKRAQKKRTSQEARLSKKQLLGRFRGRWAP